MVRVAVVYFAKSRSKVSHALAKAFAAALEKRGATVDVLDGAKSRDVKLSGYHFLAIGSDVRSAFGGNLPTELKAYLANCGIISGKRCLAWIRPSALGTSKTLLNLMKAMESEGMLLRTSEVIASVDEATLAGQRVKIDGLAVS